MEGWGLLFAIRKHLMWSEGGLNGQIGLNFIGGGPCQYQQEGKNTKTPNQIRVTLLCHGVPEILTLHGISKMDFEPEFWNPQKLSYGVKMDGLAVREPFLSKIAEKTAFWAATFSDHLTSERSSTHNFKD